jgi:hypothetical protein
VKERNLAEIGVRDRGRCRHLVRRRAGARVGPVSGASTAGITTLGAGKRAESYFESQEGANDIVGIVMLEIQGADDLPRLANSTYYYY